MTAQTQAQRSATHRARKAERMRVMEEALREIGTGYYGATAHIIAQSALNHGQTAQELS